MPKEDLSITRLPARRWANRSSRRCTYYEAIEKEKRGWKSFTAIRSRQALVRNGPVLALKRT